jgi:hypothetical protein
LLEGVDKSGKDAQAESQPRRCGGRGDSKVNAFKEAVGADEGGRFEGRFLLLVCEME